MVEYGGDFYFDVNVGDVAHNIILVVDDGEGCDAFVVHEF